MSIEAGAGFDRRKTLIAVKLVHTAIWCFIASCILGIWVTTAWDRVGWAAALSGIVIVECAVLGANRGRCPLTDVAGRYTSDRRPNFDIYLPQGLARYNKRLFGMLFAFGELYLAIRVISHR